MPDFKDREEARQRAKLERLAPHIDAALRRKERLKALADDEIPTYPAYGLTVAEVDPATLPEANRRRVETFKRMRKIIEETK
jgi:hypothetical protein